MRSTCCTKGQLSTTRARLPFGYGEILCQLKP